MNKITKGRLFCKAMQTKFGMVFLCVLAIFTVVFISYMTYAHYTLSQSQEKIKDCYALHIEKVDSMYSHLLIYNKEVVVSKQKVNDAILADSLINNVLTNTQYLSKAQSKKLQFIIENHFSQVEQLHNKYEEKLLRDSLRLCTERELLDGQTKTMIELHLNKVEHEYSNITIWAAALTILFLVFSFYSIYKMDELIQQGNEGLKDIRRIKGEGEKTKDQLKEDGKALLETTQTSIDKLKKEGKTLLEETKTSINEFVDVQQQRMQQTFEMSQKTANEMNTLYNDMGRSLGTAKENFDKRTLGIIGMFEIQMQDLLNKENNKFNSNQQRFDDLFTKANTLFEQLKGYKDKFDKLKKESDEEREEDDIC